MLFVVIHLYLAKHGDPLLTKNYKKNMVIHLVFILKDCEHLKNTRYYYVSYVFELSSMEHFITNS